MIKTLLAQVKDYKRDSILTPVCMLFEVAMEMIIPLLMASIIDEGVQAGDLAHIERVGLWMVVMAIFSRRPRFRRLRPEPAAGDV